LRDGNTHLNFYDVRPCDSFEDIMTGKQEDLHLENFFFLDLYFSLLGALFIFKKLSNKSRGKALVQSVLG
jgi:hypothetical protein